MLPSSESIEWDLESFRSRADDLGSRLEERRDALGLSRQDLARKLGTTVTWVVDLERSSSRWKNRSLIRVAGALKMPQLEIATAAGVITDLPPYPPALVTNDGTTRAHQIEVRRMLGWESSETNAIRDEIDNNLRTFTLDELQFVLVVTGQIADRRC